MSRSSLRSWGLALGICAAVLFVKVAWTGQSEFSEGQALEAAGAEHEAVIRYGRTIHMYLPGSPLPSRAAERIVVLAKAAEERGAAREARFAWEELRSGFLSVRSFYQPGGRYITEAEQALTRLMLADAEANWPPRSLSAAAREAQVRAVLDAREDPSLPWVFVMGIGLAVWLGAAGWGIWTGLPEDETVPANWPQIRRCAALSGAGYLLWLLAVWQA